jgi:CHAT domain-containing protein
LAEGIGLAQAFVVAGAGSAVAAVRRVRDEDAAALVQVYYRARAQHRPVEALRLAQNEIRTSKPAVDWSAFRIVVP